MKRLHNWFTTVLLAGALLIATLGLLMPGATQLTFAAQVASSTVYSDAATFTTQANAPPNSQVVHIISDVTVKYSETLVPGWETVAFDDSTWLNVVAPSGGLCDPSVPSRIPDSEALPVWSQTPQQFQTIYARKTFIAALPTSATIQTFVDDDFDLYVNGVLVRSDWDGVASYFVDDISALVQNGVNVIAIKASDTFGGCQNLAFDVTISGVPQAVVVPIDIKPGSDPNSINCNNENGVIAVAILTTEDFDATTVDHTTVTFEGASETHVDKKSGEPRRHEEDVDCDGDTDLVFHFRLGDTDLTCDSTEAILTGETFDGQAIEGTDAVRMIDRGGGKP